VLRTHSVKTAEEGENERKQRDLFYFYFSCATWIPLRGCHMAKPDRASHLIEPHTDLHPRHRSLEPHRGTKTLRCRTPSNTIAHSLRTKPSLTHSSTNLTFDRTPGLKQTEPCADRSRTLSRLHSPFKYLHSPFKFWFLNYFGSSCDFWFFDNCRFFLFFLEFLDCVRFLFLHLHVYGVVVYLLMLKVEEMLEGR